MTYNIKLGLTLDDENLRNALIIARQTMERRLGGPLGVEAAYIAARNMVGPDTRTWVTQGCSADQAAAVYRWQRAVRAVWTELYHDLDNLPDDTRDDMVDDEIELWIEVVGADLAPF